MRMRDPEKKLKGFIPGKTSLPEKSEWKTYKVELITPMYGGGVKAGKPDKEMPIRATAIRGQLRYWWRFLAKNRKENPLLGKVLFEREREIWGGMAENNQDYSSKVLIRVTDICNTKDVKPYIDQNPQYAQFQARRQTGAKPRDPLSFVPEGLTFNLQVKCSEGNENTISYEDDILRPLRWWANFGGLGSRTRRGCGSVEVFAPEEDSLLVGKKETSLYGCKMVVLSECNQEAIKCWITSIEILQKFRQIIPVFSNKRFVDCHGIGRKKTRQLDGTSKPSTSNWPEANAIRKKTGSFISKHTPSENAPICFPRALFGMPIEFSFMSDGQRPATSQITPFVNRDKQLHFDRLASPLIIKAVVTGTKKYASMAMLMPYDHINKLGIRLKYNNKKEEDGPWDFLAKEWNCTGDAKPIVDYQGKNALEAFMRFFEKGGRDG